MAIEKDVTLSKAGRSWVGYYYDSTGKRRGKSLGLIKGHPRNENRGLTQRQARVLRDRLAVDLRIAPRSGGRALRFGEFLNRYLESRAELRPGTKLIHDMTVRYLLEHFGSGMPIDRVTPSMASDWRTALAHGRLEGARRTVQHNGHPPTEQTVCLHTRTTKTIFNRAVADELISRNPFAHLTGTPADEAKDWKYVSLDELEKLLDACPDAGWRAFLGLCRLAGLRRAEALTLLWSHVDWVNYRLTVFAPKTGKRRVVPVEPQLQGLLQDVFDAAKPGEGHVVPQSMVSRTSLRRRFESIIRKAGLPQWADLYRVLRRNAETDWAQRFPQYVVSTWMGHDIRVSDRHYLQVPEELYVKAAGLTTEGKLQNNCKTDEPGEIRECCKSLSYQMERTGLEPATPSLQSNIQRSVPNRCNCSSRRQLGGLARTYAHDGLPLLVCTDTTCEHRCA